MKKYNLGKFNIKDSAETSVSASAEISISSACKSVEIEKLIRTDKVVEIYVDSKALAYAQITSSKAITEIVLDTKAIASNLVFSDRGFSEIEVLSKAVAALLGESYMEINNINLRPGEEVEIDMCNLTVTKNGENALHLMSSDGDFFDFLIGENGVDIVAEGAGKIQVDAYWKDRWL